MVNNKSSKKKVGLKPLSRSPKLLALVALASEPDEQFIARMKREKGEKLVEACLEQITFDPDLELDLDKDKLIDCVNREVERCRPKLKNEMKHGSRKNV